MARTKPQLDSRPLHGRRRNNLRIPLAQYRGQNGVLSSKQGPGLLLSPYPPLCVFPRSPQTARAFGKGRALAEAGLDTPGFSPPVDAGLGVSKRGGPSVSLDLTVTRAGNAGFFLSHLLESVPGRALASEAAQARESGLRCPSEGRRPGSRDSAAPVGGAQAGPRLAAVV